MVATDLCRCNSGQMGSTRDKLEKALAEQTLVRIERSLEFADREDGIVVAIGSRWLLLHRVVDGGHPDGYLAMRVKDVRAIRKDRSFARKVARALPSWPPVAPSHVLLDSTGELLSSVGEHHRLFGIEKQHERRAMWIGQLEGLDLKKAWLHELDTRAKWRKKPVGYKLGAITSVMFGDRYLASLALAAGEPRIAETVA